MAKNKENTSVISEQSLQNKLRIYKYSVLALALIAALLRTIALFTSFDPGIGYFNNNNILPVTVIALLVIGALWGISSAFLIKREDMPTEPRFNTNGVFFVSIYAGFIMLGDFVYKVYRLIKLKQSGALSAIIDRFKYASEYRDAAARTERIIAVIGVVSGVAAVLAAAYFFVRASARQNKKSHVILGMFVIIRALCGIALIYFDMNIPMNNPNKTIIQIALMAAMLYFLTEERFIIGNGAQKPWLFTATALTSVLLTATAGISCVVGFFAGLVEDGTFCLEGLICIIFFLYIYMHFSAYEKSLEPVSADAANDADIYGDTVPDTDAPDSDDTGEVCGEGAVNKIQAKNKTENKE